MLAELGLSHISLQLGEPDEHEGPRSLGVESIWRQDLILGAYEVRHVVTGDVWDSHCCGPVARPGVSLEVGSLILACLDS